MKPQARRMQERASANWRTFDSCSGLLNDWQSQRIVLKQCDVSRRLI